MITAAILGASGYGGGELLRLLNAHPSVDKLVASSRKHAGEPVHSVHPNLRSVIDQSFVAEIDWAELDRSERPVLFAAMPHGELAKQYQELSSIWARNGLDQKLVVIDLSSDFRIAGAELYQRHYKDPHPCPHLLGEWTYGFPELSHDGLLGAARIANPGCFAAALQLGLYPLTKNPGIDYVAASGATGSSGSGMAPSETTHHPTRANDFRAYKVLAHQHMAEVTQMLESHSVGFEVSFVPHSAPIVRGILVTLQFLLPVGMGPGDVEAAFFESYAGTPFVRFVEGSPRAAAVAGSNFADIGFAFQGRQAAVLVALDNLLKGMAGTAVQNMNLALGLPETDGLLRAGGYPY